MSFTKEYFDKAIERQFGIFRRNSEKALTAKQLSSVLATVANRWEKKEGWVQGSVLNHRVTYEALLEFQLDVMKEMQLKKPELLVSPQRFAKRIAELENKLKKGVEHCSRWHDPRIVSQLARRVPMSGGMCSGYDLLRHSPLTVLPLW